MSETTEVSGWIPFFAAFILTLAGWALYGLIIWALSPTVSLGFYRPDYWQSLCAVALLGVIGKSFRLG